MKPCPPARRPVVSRTMRSWAHGCSKCSRLAAGCVGLLAALGGTAFASSTSPGYVAQDYATGFPSRASVGPLGIAFDQSDRLFVVSSADGRLYSFPPGGGTTSPATEVGTSPIPGLPFGLAVTRDGRLYATRYDAEDVVELDPSSGAILRTVASGIRCATGLATDPLSDDLFVSQDCANTIFRISGLHSQTPSVTRYATLEGADGLAFDNRGTLYAESFGRIFAITGTSSPQPAGATDIADVPGSDGLAFGNRSLAAGLPFLVANRNDGIVTRIDLNQRPPARTDIFTGGTRGDFAAVDSGGCLYVTQSDRVVKITPTLSVCGAPATALSPTTPGTRQGVAANLVVGCATRKLVLVDVLQHGAHVDLLGAADRSLLGRRVGIFLSPGGKRVASAVVGSDGFFRATAPLPPKAIRDSNRTRYQARIGGDRSLDLKLRRRMIVQSIVSKNRTVMITGRVTQPFARPPAPIVVQRSVTCTRTVDVARVRPRRDGTFIARLPAPPRSQVAVFRATTLVRKVSTNPKRFRTFTLPRVVEIK